MFEDLLQNVKFLYFNFDNYSYHLRKIGVTISDKDNTVEPQIIYNII